MQRNTAAFKHSPFLHFCISTNYTKNTKQHIIKSCMAGYKAIWFKASCRTDLHSHAGHGHGHGHGHGPWPPGATLFRQLRPGLAAAPAASPSSLLLQPSGFAALAAALLLLLLQLPLEQCRCRWHDGDATMRGRWRWSNHRCHYFVLIRKIIMKLMATMIRRWWST